ncbi:MAG: adenylate/guanylate cyclase domain-containing protein [Leptospiraceae bacterium]|nr:adenylate/guanylate cyclase domain-containing protein [Leptospiraceae bacterium]
MKNKSKLIWFAAICLVPILLTVIVDIGGGLNRIEGFFIDTRFKIANPNNKFTDKLIIVDVDEHSLDTYANEEAFGRWPWSRKAYKPILEYILQGAPRMLLFDIMFFEETKTDEPLLSVTEAFNPYISHAVKMNNDELTQIELDDYDKRIPTNVKYRALCTLNSTCSSEKAKQGIEFKPSKGIETLGLKQNNIMRFPAAAIVLPEKNERGMNKRKLLGEIAENLHSVDYVAESDGVARKVSPIVRYRENTYFPILGLKGYMGYHNNTELEAGSDYLKLISPTETKQLQIKDGSYLLNYYSSKELDGVQRVPVSWIIDSILNPEKEPAIKLEAFTDKVILIGVSAASAYDTRLTPYGDRPGFLYHATMFSNLIEGHFLKVIPDWVGYILILITVPGCAALILFSQRIALRIVIPSLIFVAFPILAFLLFKMEILFPMAEFMNSYPLAFFGSLAYLSLTEGAERRKYNKVLSNMVDPTIVSEALNDLEALKKGGEKEITAFFSDVAGFSTISEQLNSTDLAALLNEYLSAMTIILKANKGTLDKYIGDAIVGIFGAPIDRPVHFLEAARASLLMIEKLADLKVYWKTNNLYSADAQEMNVRIGLNTGKAKVGFMGTDNLASYTMMGDTVNLAARLEAAGKDYGVNILISETTNKSIQEEMFTRELDLVRVKGKNEPVKLYELISIKGQTPPNLLEAAGIYEEGFKLYMAREFEKSIQKFKEVKKARGSKDKAAEQLIERCEFYLSNPPEQNWDGVFTRTHK